MPRFACAVPLLAGTFALAQIGPQTAPWTAAPSELIVFGDSFSDVGEFGPPAEPDGRSYFQNRATNGFLWWELLAAELDIPSRNPAIGGGTTQSVLDEQITLFREHSGAFASDSLVVLLVGTNDIVDQPFLFGSPGAARDAAIDALVDNLFEFVSTMSSLGAQRFMLTTQFDVTGFPVVFSDDALAGLLPTLATVDDAINARLEAETPALARQLGVSITLYDLAGLVEDVVANPGAYGITNTTEPADSDGGVVADPDAYLWWDVIHPTARFHEIFAEELVDFLQTPCSATDVAAPLGVLDLADVDAFIAGFLAGCP
ncbi:MAG: SGNH/GDSL hydrolase family protein [Planctomycetota bacterium]